MPLGYDQAALHPAVRPPRLVPDEDVRLEGRRSTPSRRREIAAAKQVIYDGFKAAIAPACRRRRPASWWTSSSAPPSCATPRPTATRPPCPAEKSGQDEFDFEYGEDFAEHIEAFHPTFCKVLVRYNPEGDAALNRRQAARLKTAVRLPARRRAAAGSCSSCWCRREGAARAARAATRRPTISSCGRS